ncbi:Glyoxalase domain-containing protein 4 [Armadillidium vulgare]|nr:Glyoxalase domain-containing protein 4 [Armadillidium vulgare]
MVAGRALHFVFKIADRPKNIHFFREILGMKVLRHEEFDEGCKAACNGPYGGKWSKTMIGYGSEDNHFVVELTYNFGISDYPLGNDFLGFYIQSAEALERAKSAGIPVKQEGDKFLIKSPDGYKFYLTNKPQPGDKGGPVDHAKAYGRIAFSCPSEELKPIEALMKEKGQTILTPYTSLDTPGKKTVEVVILADPDGHEICFVCDDGFRELSEYDPESNDALNEEMKKDKSAEWFAKKGGKVSA